MSVGGSSVHNVYRIILHLISTGRAVFTSGELTRLLVITEQHQTVASTKSVPGSVSVNFAKRCNIFAKELPSLFGVSAEINGLASLMVNIMSVLCSK